jgi:hypothetical protein
MSPAGSVSARNTLSFWSAAAAAFRVMLECEISFDQRANKDGRRNTMAAPNQKELPQLS